MDPSGIVTWLRHVRDGAVLVLQDDPVTLLVAVVGTFTLCGIALASGKSAIYFIALAIVAGYAWRLGSVGKYLAEREDSSAG